MPATQAAPPPSHTDPSAGETLTAWASEALGRLTRLDPQEMLLNVGLTVAVVVVTVLALWLAGVLLRMAWRRIDRDWPPAGEANPGCPKAVRLTWSLLRVVAVVIALGAVLAVWGLDPLSWFREGTGAALLRLALVVVVATAAMEVAGFLINRGLRTVERRTRDPRRASQLRTLAPLLRGVVQIVLTVVAIMTVLSELGVQIGPLLAGAGVVGIAVGFGAQTVVKDFLTGVFLIVEDIVSVGDIVRIGDSSGVVEQMTLRTIRLRNFDGTLHVLPYGEAQVIHNMTKTFSFAVFEIQVSYGSDIDQALEIMRRVGAEMQADPEYAELFLAPTEVVGVERLADSGVNLKGRIKTRPGSQWKVGREYNRRIKLAYDAEGIEIPFPHMQLVLPEGAPPEPQGGDIDALPPSQGKVQ